MRVVQVASGGREIDMTNVESESAGDARTRSLRRELQSSPLPASPSASQMLGSAKREHSDSPIAELNTQMMTRASRPYSSSQGGFLMPREVMTGFLSMADQWSHQVEENHQLKLQLAKQESETQIKLSEEEVKMKLTDLEKREALLQLREADRAQGERDAHVESNSHGSRNRQGEKATAAPAKSKPAKAAGPVITCEPEPTSPGSRPSVLWSGPTPDLPEPDTAAWHFSVFQCLTVTCRHVNHGNSHVLGEPRKVWYFSVL